MSRSEKLVLRLTLSTHYLFSLLFFFGADRAELASAAHPVARTGRVTWSEFRRTTCGITGKRASHAAPYMLQVRHIRVFP